MKMVVIALRMGFQAGLLVGGAALASPSEDYWAAARTMYALPTFAACTNTIVTRWNVGWNDRADHPTPGGRIGWVDVAGLRNVRDIGGWTGLQAGRAYRGCEPDCPERCHPALGPSQHMCVREEGRKTLRDVLKIRTDLDLRIPSECPDPDRSALGVPLIRAPVRPYAELFAKTQAVAWATALRVFSDARNYPVYFHCWGGADRTGTLALLLEGLCGASEVDLCIDYELTTFAGFPRSRDPNGRAKRGFVDLLEKLKSYPGASFAEKVAAFVERDLGLTKAEVSAIRANLTEECPQTPVPQVLTEFRKTAKHPRNSEGDVVRLKDGRLLVVYSRFYRDGDSAYASGAHDHSSAELVLTASADGGMTWTPERTLVRKPDGSLNVMSASFLRLGDGRLAVFYCVKLSEADCRPAMIVSADEGATWTKPLFCVDEKARGYYVLNNARASRLVSGRIALPLARHPFDGRRIVESGTLLSALSDDDGRTWRLSSDCRSGASGICLQEPGLIECGDGRLMMYARSSERRPWRLYSSDGGDHWTEPEPVVEYATTTYSPVAYARLSDGRLLVVFNDGTAHAAGPVAYERRWPLAVGVSSDEGRTWRTKILEPDDPSVDVHACYAAVREIDGRLILVYCHRDALATKRVVAVPLDWLP